MSEYTIRELINQSIQFLFISEKDIVYNALVSLVVTEDILGKEITQSMLYDYFKNQKIKFRLRDNDDRIAPRIKEINQEYRETFKPLQEGLIDRKEFGSCIDAIENEKSFIICGSAGYGKSVCTEAILNYCERKRMPYIAIKLDRRIPKGNCERWGAGVGLAKFSRLCNSLYFKEWKSHNSIGSVGCFEVDTGKFKWGHFRMHGIDQAGKIPEPWARKK